VVLLVCLLQRQALAQQLDVGTGSFVFKTLVDKKKIKVWYHMPDGFDNSSNIVFVMHGLKRNARQYRDIWVGYAKEGRFLLLVPEFSKKHYPGNSGYNLGNMVAESGKINDEALWSFSVIEDLFDHVKSVAPSDAPGYHIYGHSAGAQFVHRLMMFKPNARIRSAVAANAGWYTMPTDDVAFPYGLRDSGRQLSSVVPAFERNLTILLGSKDTDQNHKYLRKSSEAMSQGTHRFARGHTFFEMAKQAAKHRKAQFNWKLTIIYGVGHSNALMSIHAARLFY
jgi:poly(3-hydroxybutyrate) depolymerase